ncbi:MAG: dihydrodipicolinate synthase family protein [Kiritimatiellae bacterium]|nr:dihydrodipicolinate synthase family protein [Kiritimatiellia bacterium]
MVLPRPLRGIIVPMITPLTGRDSLDHAGVERLVEHLIQGGVHGVFVLGTTGEAPSLSHRLRREFIGKVCDLVNGRIPVLVGITDTAFVESVSMARWAAEAGANGVVLAPPYYFPAGQAELLEYLEHIVPELPLPVFLYNMPTHTKLEFEAETVRIAANLANVVGLKDSSANMIYFHHLQLLFGDKPDFALLIGVEELLAEALLLGAHGGVCGGANLWPRLYVNLYHAVEERNLERIRDYHRTIMQIHATIYSVGRYRSSTIKGIKCALACLGICDDFMAEPFHRFRPEHREIVRRHLGELGLFR